LVFQQKKRRRGEGKGDLLKGKRAKRAEKRAAVEGGGGGKSVFKKEVFKQNS